MRRQMPPRLPPGGRRYEIMLSTIYPVIWWAVVVALLIFITLMILRLTANYSDPNPFGAVGRFFFKLKKLTDRWVYPAARFLATFRVDTRLAPLVTMFVAAILSYFVLGIVSNTFFIIDGYAESLKTGNVSAFIGYTLYAAISIYILFIFIRFISMWFVFTRNTFLSFVQRVTDPVLIPFRKLIPPIGMFDISAMILLLLLSFLQMMVLNIFVRS